MNANLRCSFVSLKLLNVTHVYNQSYFNLVFVICFYRRTTRFSTFPDYLMVQMKKFTLGDDWVPKKLGKLEIRAVMLPSS